MTKGLEKSKKYDYRGLATLKANGALIILEERLHLLVKDLQLLGCEGTTVFSPWRRRLVTAAFAGAVPHVQFLVPLLLGFKKINCLLELMGSRIPSYWAGFWPIVVAQRR